MAHMLIPRAMLTRLARGSKLLGAFEIERLRRMVEHIMDKNRIGALQVTLAAVFWSFAGVLCKWIPWNAFTLNGVRALLGAIMLGMVRRSFRVKITRGTLLGAAGVALTSCLFMVATKLTTSANAIVLQYAMPVFVIAFCWIFYHQRPSAGNLVTAAFVMLGVVLCSWEGLSAGNPLGDILALLSAVTFALVFFCSRLPGANSQDYSFLGLVMCVPCIIFGFFDPNITANPLHWLAATGMAVCLAGGYYFIAQGMNKVSPTSAALLANIEPILNPFWVFIFLGEKPGPLTLVGASIVLIAATVYAVCGNREDDSSQESVKLPSTEQTS